MKKPIERLGCYVPTLFHWAWRKKKNILYQSTILPGLEYVSSVWSHLAKKNIEKLEKLQAKCLHLCKKFAIWTTAEEESNNTPHHSSILQHPKKKKKIPPPKQGTQKAFKTTKSNTKLAWLIVFQQSSPTMK